MTEVGLLVLSAVLAVAVPGGWHAARRRRARWQRVEVALEPLADLPAIRDVVVGTPPDPIRGLPAQPSVAERLAALELAVASREQLTARLAALEGWRDEHVRTCGGGIGVAGA